MGDDNMHTALMVLWCRWQVMFQTPRATLSIGLPVEWPNITAGRVGVGPVALTWWPWRGDKWKSREVPHE